MSGHVYHRFFAWNCNAVILRFSFLFIFLANSHYCRAKDYETAASHALLMDYETETILFEKNSDQPVFPGNIVKLATAERVFYALHKGNLTLETEYNVSENAWKKGGGPSGETAMFAALNSSVSVKNLLKGLIIDNGNDAALVLAEGLAGTEEHFVHEVNERLHRIGLHQTKLATATGYNNVQGQTTTLKDVAKLVHHIVNSYPDLLPIYKEREFTWNKIQQTNKNPLIGTIEGAEGFVTASVKGQGTLLVGSFIRAGRRLIVITCASDSKTARSETENLIEWGYKSFEKYKLFSAHEELTNLTTYGGDKRGIMAVTHQPVHIFLQKSATPRLSAKIHYTGPLQAPISKGTEIGALVIRNHNIEILRFPVFAGEDINLGGLSDKAFDNIYEFFSSSFRKAIGG